MILNLNGDNAAKIDILAHRSPEFQIFLVIDRISSLSDTMDQGDRQRPEQKECPYKQYHERRDDINISRRRISCSDRYRGSGALFAACGRTRILLF